MVYRYALAPRWIASHLLALFVVALFLNLGAWQLRRHDERAERNAVVEARAELPPVDVAELVPVGADAPADDGADGLVVDPDALRFRQATASGRYGERTLLVDNRSRDGLPGAWVLAALDLPDGRTLVVTRGFEATKGGDIDPPAPPEGGVAVVGTLVPWGGSCGSRTDDDGRTVGMACLDRATAEAVFDHEVLPVVLQRQASTPEEPATLTPVPLPELGPGPHRGYAGQWFIFATIVGVVYVLILRKVARERAAPDGGRVGTDPLDEPVVGGAG